MNELEKYELIDQYLEGKLTGRSLDDFSFRLSSDTAFAEEVEAQRISNQIIFENRLVELKHALQQKHFHKQKPWWRKGLIAAAALLLISFTAYFFLIRDDKTNEAPSIASKKETETSAPVQREKETSMVKEDTTSVLQQPQENKIEDSLAEIEDNLKTQPASPIARESKKPPKGSGKITLPENKGQETQIQRIQQIDVTGNCYLTFNRAFIVSPSCQGKADGSIEINASAISGGGGQYEIYANKDKLKSPYILANIPSGKYLIRIRDHQSCTDSINIFVPAKTCP